MTIEFEEDLVLEEDKNFGESIKVKGNICCEGGRHDLIVSGSIDAQDIDAKDIDAWNIDAKDIDAWDIDAADIDAADIDAWNIDAKDIDAWNIDAKDIDALDIDAKDIDALDIDAKDIDALDIKFYGSCIVYKSVSATSIEGRRDNHVLKALDGDVEIRDKKTEVCEACGQKIKDEEVASK